MTDQKTGVVKGYFLSEQEFGEYLKWRKASPKAGFAREMSPDMIEELRKPLPEDYPDLEHLMEEESDVEGGSRRRSVTSTSA